MPVDELMAMLNDPNIVITIAPKGADKISEFLAKIGRIKATPDNRRRTCSWPWFGARCCATLLTMMFGADARVDCRSRRAWRV